MSTLAQLAARKVSFSEISSLLHEQIPTSIKKELTARVTLDRLHRKGLLDDDTLFEVAISNCAPKLLWPYFVESHSFLVRPQQENPLKMGGIDPVKKRDVLAKFRQDLDMLVTEHVRQFRFSLQQVVVIRLPSGYRLVKAFRAKDSITTARCSDIDALLKTLEDEMISKGALYRIRTEPIAVLSTFTRTSLAMINSISPYNPVDLWSDLTETHICLTSNLPITPRELVADCSYITLQVLDDYLFITHYGMGPGDLSCYSKEDGLLLVGCLGSDDTCWRYGDDAETFSDEDV